MKISIYACAPCVALALAAFPALAGNIVVAPNFSSPTPFPTGGSYPGYGAVDGWTASTLDFTGNNTIGGPFWDNGTAPDGISTVGFIQVSDNNPTGSLSQMLNLDPGTVYDFSFAENVRDSSTFPEVEVLLDGTVIVAQSVLSAVDTGGDYSDPFAIVSGSFTATSSTQTLEFRASEQVSGPDQDATWLITGVDVEATPEPGTAGLMSLALAGCCIAGFRLRRKRANSFLSA